MLITICISVFTCASIYVQEQALSQPAQKSSSSPTACRRPTWNRQDSGPIAMDDKNKAYDAIIVAAGIVAVLIANVTYVGELQTTIPEEQNDTFQLIVSGQYA